MDDNKPLVTGLFRDRDSAERAYQTVSDRGYTREDVNLAMSDETRKRHFGDTSGRQTELGTKAAEGAGIGGAIGGTLGAIAAAIAAVGTSIATTTPYETRSVTAMIACDAAAQATPRLTCVLSRGPSPDDVTESLIPRGANGCSPC